MDNKSDKELAIDFAKAYITAWHQSTIAKPMQVQLIPEILKISYEAVKKGV